MDGASWLLCGLDLLGDQSNTLLVSLLLNDTNSLILVSFSSFVVAAYMIESFVPCRSRNRHSASDILAHVFSFAIRKTYLAGVDVLEVERIAGESDTSRLCALHEEGVLAACVSRISSASVAHRVYPQFHRPRLARLQFPPQIGPRKTEPTGNLPD